MFIGIIRVLDSSWSVTAHGDVREGKWRGNWRMQWVASTLHTTSEHGVSSITTADAHTSAASSRLNWPPPHGRFKWTRPFRAKDEIWFLLVCHHISTGLYYRRSFSCVTQTLKLWILFKRKYLFKGVGGHIFTAFWLPSLHSQQYLLHKLKSIHKRVTCSLQLDFKNYIFKHTFLIKFVTPFTHNLHNNGPSPSVSCPSNIIFSHP